MKNAERTERTRAALIAAARQLFADKGYAATSTTDVVRRAGVTRGAMYHHFADKQALFREVLLAVQQDLDTRVGAAASKAYKAGDDPLSVFLTGVDALLAASAGPEVARIVLIEGPTVLGAEEWRRIDDSFNERTLSVGLQHLMNTGWLEPQPVLPLVRLFVGMLNEASLTVALADDRGATRRRMSLAVRRLLTSLCSTPAATPPDERVANRA